mgnify:CR=1 FL=1
MALLPARTDTGWWHEHVAERADVFLLRGCLAFGDGEQSAPFPSALAVWGAIAEIIKAPLGVLESARHITAAAPFSNDEIYLDREPHV